MEEQGSGRNELAKAASMELPEPEENGPTTPHSTEENHATEERLQKAEHEVEEAAEENADSCSDAESETAPSDRGYRKSYSDAESQTSRLPLTPERSRECYSRARMLLPRIHHHLNRELEIEAENLREQVSQLTQEKLDLIKEAEASSAVAFCSEYECSRSANHLRGLQAAGCCRVFN